MTYLTRENLIEGIKRARRRRGLPQFGDLEVRSFDSLLKIWDNSLKTPMRISGLLK